MKKYFIIIVYSLLILLKLNAQSSLENLYRVSTESISVGVGTINRIDPYLSPFLYSGHTAQLSHSSGRFSAYKTDCLAFMHETQIAVSSLSHPTGNNSMQLLSSDYQYGMYYIYRPTSGLKLLAGAAGSLDILAGYLGRNVNNPMSFNMLGQLNLSGEAYYPLKILNREFPLLYKISVPVTGLIFSMPRNISFYELYLSKNIGEALFFSSPHNNQGLTHQLNIDIPVRFNTFRIRIDHKYLRFNTDNQTNKVSHLVFSVGSVFRLYKSRGKQHNLPENFISIYD